MGLRSIRSAELRAECLTLERGVLRQGLASADELAPWKPGGESNTGKDARAWLSYFAKLHRVHARGEKAELANAGFDPHDLNDRRVLDALRNDPIPVDLLDRVTRDDGTLLGTVHVYAKSLDALLHVHALDRVLAQLLVKKSQLELVMGPTSDVVLKTAEVIAYTYHLLAWIVTTPGPEMPWAPDDVDPAPPSWVAQLQPWDVVRICQATQEHQLRLAALSQLVDVKTPAEGGTRPSWSMFIANLAMEMKEPAGRLMKHRALIELLATVHLVSAAREIPDREPAGDGTGILA